MAKRVSHKAEKPAKRVVHGRGIRRAQAPIGADLLDASVDDLKACSDAFYGVAVELSAAARRIKTESSQTLYEKAVGVQKQSMRAAVTALTARAVSERLETVTRIEADDE